MAGLGWYPFSRLKPATRILLLHDVSNRRPCLLNCNGAAQIRTGHCFLYHGARVPSGPWPPHY